MQPLVEIFALEAAPVHRRLHEYILRQPAGHSIQQELEQRQYGSSFPLAGINRRDEVIAGLDASLRKNRDEHRLPEDREHSFGVDDLHIASFIVSTIHMDQVQDVSSP